MSTLYLIRHGQASFGTDDSMSFPTPGANR